MAAHRVGPRKVEPLQRLLLDSSFLIAVVEHPTRWREDLLEKIGKFEPVVILPVYDELANLSAGRTRARRYAALAKELVDRGDFLLVEARGTRTADDELVSLALEGNAAVATLDRELAAQLRAAHVPVVGLRKGRVSLV